MRLSRLFLVMVPMAVAACSGNEVRSTLGLDRKAPDEFVVYSRPPLSVPPEFDLMPPRPGAENPQAVSTQAQARETLLGTKERPSSLDDVLATQAGAPDTAVIPVLAADAPSSAQSSFLSKAGADKADASIRDTLRVDATTEPANKKRAQSLYEEIIGNDKVEPVVDAEKEAERLRTNKEEGKPVTEGETPVESTKPKSLIDQVF